MLLKKPVDLGVFVMHGAMSPFYYIMFAHECTLLCNDFLGN